MARQQVPRTVRVLFVAGSALLLLALTSLVYGILRWGAEHPWDADSVVPVDGRTHTVAINAGRPTWLWVPQDTSAPDCDIEATSGPLVARDVPGPPERPSKLAPVLATTSLSADDDVSSLRIICTHEGEQMVRGETTSLVYLEPEPRLPDPLLRLAPSTLLAVVLAALGALAWVVGLVLSLLSRRRWEQQHP